MTDYPTAAEIDAARDTLVYLHSHVDKSTLLALIAREALWDAARILDALDDVPGLHYPAEPKPEPKPTAADVLEEAWRQTEDGSANESILHAALRYAQTNPEWFADWHETSTPTHGLSLASDLAYKTEDWVAVGLLRAAACVALKHRHLFGGAA